MNRLQLNVMIGLLAAPALLQAEDPPPPSASVKPWSEKAEASVISTNGNSKGTTTSVKNTFGYNWSKVTGLEINAAGTGSTHGNDVTAENYLANEKVTWKLVGK